MAGEVGIPASMADDYYEKSLATSKEIIKDGDMTCIIRMQIKV